MSFQSVSNEKLLLDLESLFSQERKTSHHILLHLREIKSRRLYAERGYPNMFSMLVQHFHQSEAAANQRLRALELMVDVPAVEERLVSGELNLSTVALAQRQIRREERILGKKMTSEKKAEIVESITSKTLAEVEIELFKHLPLAAEAPQTFERRISENATRMTLTLPDEVREKMTRLQEIWAHVDPRMDPVEVIDRAFDIALAKVDPTLRKKKEKIDPAQRMKIERISSSRPEKAESKPSTANQTSDLLTQRLADSAKQCVNNPSTSNRLSGRTQAKRLTYYGKEFDRQLWEKAQSRCEFVDPISGKRCDCRHGLQRDHIIPLGRGGSNDISNMQLLCSTHNLL
ncbi:MAG: HNH endonuclease, partial [Pseudobdellovibrionaceae bacterium]